VRPVSGIGTRDSTRETLFQLDEHPPVLIVRREIDVAKADVEPLRRVDSWMLEHPLPRRQLDVWPPCERV